MEASKDSQTSRKETEQKYITPDRPPRDTAGDTVKHTGRCVSRQADGFSLTFRYTSEHRVHRCVFIGPLTSWKQKPTIEQTATYDERLRGNTKPALAGCPRKSITTTRFPSGLGQVFQHCPGACHTHRSRSHGNRTTNPTQVVESCKVRLLQRPVKERMGNMNVVVWVFDSQPKGSGFDLMSAARPVVRARWLTLTCS